MTGRIVQMMHTKVVPAELTIPIEKRGFGGAVVDFASPIGHDAMRLSMDQKGRRVKDR